MQPQPILLLYLKGYLTCIVCSYSSDGNVKKKSKGVLNVRRKLMIVILPGGFC